MDTDDKVNVDNSAQMDSTNESQTNLQDSFTEEVISNKPDLEKINTCEMTENMEKHLQESITQKEPVEILSVELVTHGTEVESVKEIETATQEEVKKQTVDNVEATIVEEISGHSMDGTVVEEATINSTTEDTQESMEIPKEVNDKEIHDDENMESDVAVGKTTDTIDDFSKESTTILSGIANIQSTVETTPSNTESTVKDPPSGLSLLAQYDSDNDDDDKISDTESVIEVPSTSANDYRNQVVEINSDSDSDSDSSSDVEYLNEIRKTIEKRIEVVDEEGDEEEEDDENEENVGRKKHKSKLKVKGEMLLEDLPPIQDLQITVPENECIEFGKIHSIVDQLVLVTAFPDAILLDLETVIFLEKGQKVLGEVFDVLGQVADPMYCVRFNSNKHIKEKEITIGDVVYVAPKTQYTQYVILSSLMRLKGSDASWENDIEPPPRFLDYSDDEQEQMARRQLRNKDRPIDNDDPHKRPRTSESGQQENNTSNTSSYNPKQNNRFGNRRGGGRGGSNYNSYSRPQYNNTNSNHRHQQQPQQQQQQQPNHHRSSWHSNYYPQRYQAPPPNFGYAPNNGPTSQNQQPPPHAYPSQAPPMYAIPPMHTMPYPPNFVPHGGPHIPPPHQLMPNAFNIRPPTLGNGPPQQQQYNSPPPPPPGGL